MRGQQMTDEEQPIPSSESALRRHDGPSPDPDTFPWRQAHPSFIILGLVRQLRGLVVPFAVLVVSGGFNSGERDLIWYGIAIAFAAFSAIVSVLAWWFQRFRVTDREIMSRSGIIAKQERVVPFERIQTVDLDEAPLERIFRTVKVRVETAAGGQAGTEIEIPALRRDDATALRQQLLLARQRAREGSTPGNGNVSDSTPPPPMDEAAEAPMPDRTPAPVGEIGGALLRRVTARELLIAGATSGRFGPAAAIVGAVAQFGDDLIPQSIWERVPWDDFADAASNIQLLIGAVTLLGIVAWLLAIATTVLTFGGFELRREADQLFLQYGLLDRRRTTIPIRRIQAIQVREGVLRQPFGLADVRFATAGFGNDASSSGVLFPLLPMRDVRDLLSAACPEFLMEVQRPRLERPPARARMRYIFETSIGWVIAVVIAALIGWRLLDVPYWWLWVVVAACATPVFAWLGARRFADAGWLVEDGRMLLRWRAVGRVTMLTRVRRIQYRRLTSNPLQRRASLVSFEMSVAGGGAGGQAGLAHLDRNDAERLVQRLSHASDGRVQTPTWRTPPRVVVGR